ncbi:hypothetical protein C8J55DRAFT_493292 [Lentinula edodes]|uniref:Uncharacterized protein n=1 Tax=Lentinula lateritia TaxID=40482 RepID=A0A9W8ZSU3_9AGAR|nr:hypothetical protein C8J55DRAFT_493292 [Lentinula edodes]
MVKRWNLQLWERSRTGVGVSTVYRTRGFSYMEAETGIMVEVARDEEELDNEIRPVGGGAWMVSIVISVVAEPFFRLGVQNVAGGVLTPDGMTEGTVDMKDYRPMTTTKDNTPTVFPNTATVSRQLSTTPRHTVGGGTVLRLIASNQSKSVVLEGLIYLTYSNEYTAYSVDQIKRWSKMIQVHVHRATNSPENPSQHTFNHERGGRWDKHPSFSIDAAETAMGITEGMWYDKATRCLPITCREWGEERIGGLMIALSDLKIERLMSAADLFRLETCDNKSSSALDDEPLLRIVLRLVLPYWYEEGKATLTALNSLSNLAREACSSGVSGNLVDVVDEASFASSQETLAYKFHHCTYTGTEVVIMEARIAGSTALALLIKYGSTSIDAVQ